MIDLFCPATYRIKWDQNAVPWAWLRKWMKEVFVIWVCEKLSLKMDVAATADDHINKGYGMLSSVNNNDNDINKA